MLDKCGKLAYIIFLKLDRFPFVSFLLVLISLGLPFNFYIPSFPTFQNMSSTTTLTHFSFETFFKTHYPPPVLIKHHFWYLDNANLYVSIQGTLYGIHHTYFKPFHYYLTTSTQCLPFLKDIYPNNQSPSTI